jgi:hypothetical protein
MVPGPRVSQTRCSPAGSSLVANPLSSSVNPIPAAVVSGHEILNADGQVLERWRPAELNADGQWICPTRS